MLAALHLTPIEVECGPAEHFRFTADLLDRVEAPAKGLLFSSPANPTGAMLDEAQIRNLIAAADARGLRVISDEIYHGLAFDKPCFSAARFEEVMVINSFSKFWRMTGWRIGWMVAPSDLAPLIERLAQNLFLSPSAPAQVAALQALEEAEDARSAVAAYRANRDAVLATLGRLGVTSVAPADGAFYVFADVSALTNDSEAFVKRLLHETGVALAPGIDFDLIDGHRWVRICISGPSDGVNAGLERLESWVAGEAAGGRLLDSGRR
jgi:aspartate/methionine/tyrosine aminotransferase